MIILEKKAASGWVEASDDESDDNGEDGGEERVGTLRCNENAKTNIKGRHRRWLHWPSTPLSLRFKIEFFESHLLCAVLPEA